MVWFVMWLTGGGQISCFFLCQNCHIFYSPLAEVFTFGEASAFFVRYFFHWISVVDADVAASMPGLSECGGGLNDVKVLKV